MIAWVNSRNLRTSFPMLQHATREIPPSRLDECVSFYTLVGFTQVSVPEGIRGRALWMERSGTQIHLMPNPSAVPEHGHIGVIVDDYEKVLERLRADGFEVDARREHWGSPRSYVRDPAGNLVELMAWGPRESGPASSPAHAARGHHRPTR